MSEKTNYLIVCVLGVALGMSLSALFITFQISNPFEESNWGKHSRCYYFNLETECGKTRYCATHVSKERCYELKGSWKLETPELEMFERAYFFMFEDKNG